MGRSNKGSDRWTITKSTWESAVERYLATIPDPEVRSEASNAAKGFFKSSAEDPALLRPDDLERFRDSPKCPVDHVYRRRLRHLAAIYDMFVATRLIPSNPVTEYLGAERWGYRGASRSLSARELDRVLMPPRGGEIRDLRNHCLTSVAIVWGARPADLVLLRWGPLRKLRCSPLLRAAFLRYHRALGEPRADSFAFPRIRRSSRRQPIDLSRSMSVEGVRLALALWGTHKGNDIKDLTPEVIVKTYGRFFARTKLSDRHRPPWTNDRS